MEAKRGSCVSVVGGRWSGRRGVIVDREPGAARAVVGLEACPLADAEMVWIRVDELSVEVQAAPSPIMDAVRSQPGLAHVQGTDHELLLTVLRSTVGWAPRTARWSHVRDVTKRGSGVGSAICAVIGVDPDKKRRDDGERCGGVTEDETTWWEEE